MVKLSELIKYSDPQEVERKAMQLHLNEVHPSSRANKKYMVFDGTRMIHFGQIPYMDFTKTHDDKKRMNFRKRNHKWANAPKYSPAFLSYYLLW